MAEPRQVARRLGEVRARVQQIVQGKDELVKLTLVAVLAGGHILLEDVPGVGKTTLAHALARALGGSFRRVQFTSDLLPSDVLGTTVLDRASGNMGFRPGPIFANVVLADEINRTTPKTQSCLLEAMNERRVSVDGVSHALPKPFLVVATQNPHDDHGTYPLPESQLDRFLMRLSVGYPDREAERAVLRAGGFRETELSPAIQPEELEALSQDIGGVTFHAQLEDYLLELVARTRADARFLRGASTRGAEALYRASRALALCEGRDFVVPEDIRSLVVPVLGHRMSARSEAAGATEQALRELMWEIPAPQ